ncbi:MATE efflux family protein [Artemisia annua]|uniref:MATE efflux family protein n=1 Tax=Artemisia annua TaxID=35608 RepID=A0A2U1PY53_ARTAN|nr:MATE efflux family protein [Artemisia annua]
MTNTPTSPSSISEPSPTITITTTTTIGVSGGGESSEVKEGDVWFNVYEKCVIEEDFLLTTEQPRRWDFVLADEVKRTCYIALPMVVVLVSQNLLEVSSITMVGRRTELEHAGTTIATSLTNVTDSLASAYFGALAKSPVRDFSTRDMQGYLLRYLMFCPSCDAQEYQRIRCWESRGCKNGFIGHQHSALRVEEVIIANTILFCSRSVLGYAFGIARGSGWQHVGVYICLGSYYLIGILMALVLGFLLHPNGKGLWSGLINYWDTHPMHSAHARYVFYSLEKPGEKDKTTDV